MDDKAIIKSFERGWGQRMGILAFAVLMLAALAAVLIMGFRGRHISQNAAAMTEPAAPTVHLAPATRPADQPAR